MSFSHFNALRRAFRVVAVTTALILPAAFAHGADTLEPGDAFPALADFTLEGEVPDLSGARVVLVDFWASWCAPCKASFPVFDELTEIYGSKGLVIIAVSVDQNAGAMEKFLQRAQPRFAVVRDAGQKLAAAVQVPAMPSSYLLDAAGKVRFVHRGFHGRKSRDDYIQEIETLLTETP